MQDREMIELIRDAESAEKLEQVADRIAADILDAPAAIVHVWATGTPNESDKAGMVAMDLGPLPLEPLIAESHDKSASVQTRFRLLAEAAEIHSDLRRHLFRRLDRMLDDETPLPPEELEPGWGDLPSIRVCDKAHVWIHRLVGVDNTPVKGFAPEADFIRLASVARDREIHRWRRSEFWKALLKGE